MNDPTKAIPADRENIINLSLCDELVPGEAIVVIRENIKSYRLRLWDKLFGRDNLGYKKTTPWGVWSPQKKGMASLEGSLNNVWLDSDLSAPFLDGAKQESLKREMELGGGVALQDSLFARMQVRGVARDLIAYSGGDVPKEVLDMIPLFLPLEGEFIQDKWIFLDLPSLATLSWDKISDCGEKIWLIWGLRACLAGFPVAVVSRAGVLPPERLLSPVSARFCPIQAIISACWAMGAADDYQVVMSLDHPVKKRRGAYIRVSFSGEGRNRLSSTNAKVGNWKEARLKPPPGMTDRTEPESVEKYKQAKKEAKLSFSKHRYP